MKPLVALLFSLLAWVSWLPVQAADSLRVSLITCSPGRAIFELYGHTALRITDWQRGTDVAYNFGIFSFDQPNFIGRFIQGQTDYTMAAVPYAYFEQSYLADGRWIDEQELALLPAEARRLQHTLDSLSSLRGWTYRYNFFGDNCTTRIRQAIEEAVATAGGGRISTPPAREPATYRSIVHRYTAQHPWDELGQDLLLGAEADRPISTREQQFVPFGLKQAFEHATLTDRGGTRRLVSATGREGIELPPAQAGSLTPMGVALMWLLLTLVVCGARWHRRRAVWWAYDALPLAVQGAIGCVIAYLFFFSSHPTVGSNWLLVAFNPLPLLYLPFELWRAKQGRRDAYHVVASVVILLFLVASPFIPQDFPDAILVLALNLLILSVTHIYIGRTSRRIPIAS